MKKSIFSILALVAIGITLHFQSCKRESLKDSNSLSYNYQKDSLVAPLSDAFEVAANVNKSNFVLKTGNTNFKSAKYLGKRVIKNSITILDKEQKNPYFYVVNYESGGYTIISSDKRMSPIFGYSDNGYFDLDSIPLGLASLLEHNASLIKNLRYTNGKQTAAIAA